MKTSKELLKKNGWEKYGYNSISDEAYYLKTIRYGAIYLAAHHDNPNNVTILTTDFESRVEPDFLRQILEEVDKLKVK